MLHYWLECSPGVTQSQDAPEPGSSGEHNLPAVVFPVESQHREEDVLVTDG